MPAIETKIWQALKARVQTLSGGLAINWPMEPFTSPTASGKPLPYLDVAQMPNRVIRPFVGSKENQDRPGILQIALMWPVSEIGAVSGKTHPDEIRQRAGMIAAHFGTDQCLSFQGTRVRITKAPDVAQPMRDDAYWRVPIRSSTKPAHRSHSWPAKSAPSGEKSSSMRWSRDGSRLRPATRSGRG